MNERAPHRGTATQQGIASRRNTAPLDRYTQTATRAAAEVISTYSTSFGAATSLLGKRHRHHVRNLYALVRVADELVDGVADAAGLDAQAQSEALDRFVAETKRALATGYSSDLIVHAFAHTARAARITSELTDPFFASMRADLPNTAATNTNTDASTNTVTNTSTSTDTPHRFDREQHAAYVYGSAEVVGLMCLRVFTRDRTLTPAENERLEHGAKQLGAAFQNINFLRDLADDTDRLGRSYLSTEGRLTDADREGWIRTIRTQLSDAQGTLPLLPKDARGAVRSALNLFTAVADRLEATPIEQLYRERVRVSNLRKTGILVRSMGRTLTEAS